MNLKACRQHTWIVTLLCVGHCFCAVTLTQSSTNVDKGSSLNIIATLDEASLSWTYKGGTPLSTCSLALNACFPSLEENMMFTASSTTNTSTLSIASLNCSINTAVYVASTGSLLTDTVNIDVTTPVSSRVSTTVLTASKVPSQDLLVEVKCVYPRSTITANFTISRSGKPDDILFPDSIQTSTSSSGCECFEDTYVVKKTITALQYPNEVVQVQANIGQLSPLVIGDVNFTAGPITQTSMDYVVEGIPTTNFNVELSSSTPVNMEEVIPTSDVIVSMENPYDTNTVKTVILIYHSTDSLSMQTSDQSIKTITASQSLQTTSVWDKSSLTDSYFQETSGLQLTSSDTSISLYDSFSTQSLNQSILLSVQTQSGEVSLESTITQSNISFTNTDGFPISLQISYSSKYFTESSGGISPLTVYPSSGLLKSDLFVQSSEVRVSLSKFEITNPGRLFTFSTNLESDFIDEITKTLKASYFLIDFSSSNTLVSNSVMQQNTNRQTVTTSDQLITSFLSSDLVIQNESEYSESYSSNYSSILWTSSSYQYVFDTSERLINTDKDPSYLLKSTQPITITESFHTLTNVKDEETPTGELETSLKITKLLSDYLVMDFQSNKHLLSTESSVYFVTTIQADMASSALEMEAPHTNTVSNVTILHTSAVHTIIQTLQSEVSSQIYSSYLMSSYRHYQSSDIELLSSYFKTSSQTVEKHSSYTSNHVSTKTLTVSKGKLTGIAKDDEHLSTTSLSISGIQTGMPVEQSIESSKIEIKVVTQTTETIFKSKYIEPGTHSLKYASTEATFHDSSVLYSSSSDFIILTSGEFAPGLSPASDISSTSEYFTSTAIQNIISEQTKDIIVISATTSIICFSVLILLISLFVKKYLQKPKPTIDLKSNQIEWTNDIQSNDDTNKKVSTDSLYLGESSIFTRLNTKWHSYAPPYQHNWDDI